MTKEENKNKTFKNAKSKRTERFSDMLLQVTTDLAKTKSLDEALETLVKITTSTIGAERGTIFLNDASTGELYSRIAQGNFRREIRILNSKVLPGGCFQRIKELLSTTPTRTNDSTRLWMSEPASERKVFFVLPCAQFRERK